jgi:hypothetical protein
MANKGGRPCILLDKKMIDIFLDAIREGNYYHAACRKIGLNPRTFYLWMQKGREGGGERYLQFFQSVRAAEAECESTVVANWVAQCPLHWRACMQFLRYRFPQRWNRPQKHEVSGPRREPKRIIAAKSRVTEDDV